MINSGKSNRRYFDYLTGLKEILQNKKNRSLIWLAVTIFTICFFAVAVIRPTLITIAKLSREIKDKKELKIKLQQKIDAIIIARDEYSKVSPDIPLLFEALPEKNRFTDLALFLEKKSEENGVILDSLSFERISTKQGEVLKDPVTDLNNVRFSTAVAGDYIKINNFLRNLETSLPVIRIDNANINRAEKKDLNTNALVLTLNGVIYYEK